MKSKLEFVKIPWWCFLLADLGSWAGGVYSVAQAAQPFDSSIFYLNMKGGIPWQSNDKLWASTSGGHRFDPWSGELRSHMPWGTTEKRKEKRKTEKKKSGTSASGQISLFRIESHDRHSESVVCKPGSLFYDCWWKIIKTPDCTCPVFSVLAPEGGPQRPPVSVIGM